MSFIWFLGFLCQASVQETPLFLSLFPGGWYITMIYYRFPQQSTNSLEDWRNEKGPWHELNHPNGFSRMTLQGKVARDTEDSDQSILRLVVYMFDEHDAKNWRITVCFGTATATSCYATMHSCWMAGFGLHWKCPVGLQAAWRHALRAFLAACHVGLKLTSIQESWIMPCSFWELAEFLVVSCPSSQSWLEHLEPRKMTEPFGTKLRDLLLVHCSALPYARHLFSCHNP